MSCKSNDNKFQMVLEIVVPLSQTIYFRLIRWVDIYQKNDQQPASDAIVRGKTNKRTNLRNYAIQMNGFSHTQIII